LKQGGSTVAVTDAGWNAMLPEKATTYFGMVVDYTGTKADMTDVRLNGFPCVQEP
jgi:hypothetical protein